MAKVDNPIKALEDQIIAMQASLSEIPEERETYRYAEGKWSIKEIVGHLIDTERIFGYRALCIARKDKNSFPGFDENAYVAAANFDSLSFYDLAHEFSIVRESHLSLFKSFTPDALSEMGFANKQAISVRAILFIMAGHEIHHLKVIRERYLNPPAKLLTVILHNDLIGSFSRKEKTMKINWKFTSGLILLFALLLAACGSGGEEPAADTDTTAETGDTASDDTAVDEPATTDEKMTIVLVANAWSACELNVAVAKILLENELGYSVEVISLDENAQWPALASGDAHARLEVWPSGHAANVTEYIDGAGTVENGGLLGPVGRIGWYMPMLPAERSPRTGHLGRCA